MTDINSTESHQVKNGMPGPLGGAVVELPGVLKGLGRFGRPESSPKSVKKNC